MYNSIIVGGLVKLWNLFYSLYENSFLKKIADKINKFFSYLFQYSKTKRIFLSKDSLISKSNFYKGFSKTALFIDRIFETINKFFRNLSSESFIYKNIQGQFKDNMNVLKTISVFVIALFIGIIFNSLFIFRQGSINLYLASIVSIFIGVFIFRIANNYEAILNNSKMWGLISGLFIIDKGGKQWW